MSPTTRQAWTYADYARLPDDGNRYEVLDGEVLVTPRPSPTHQHVAGTLYVALRRYVERERLGVVLDEVDLLFQPGHFLSPDLLVVPKGSQGDITNRGVDCTPTLVIEVLSPTSGSIDRVKKPARYGDFGVPEYWVVDPAERVVWLWRFETGAVEPERLDDVLEWRPAGVSEPFSITLEELMRTW